MHKPIKNSFAILSLASVCSVALLAGCNMGPHYVKPLNTVPDTWLSAPLNPKAELQQDWWKQFNDPVLDNLIAKANDNNLDLKIAATRIAQARAARSTASNDLLPTINMDASAERQANRLAFGNTPFDLAKPFNIYQTGFDATWELDLFGGKRRAVEAAIADLQAAEADADAGRISILAEVARTYMDIRQYQAQLAITHDTITANEKIVTIAQERFKVGEAAGLDVIQAQAQVQQANAQLPYYQNLLMQTEYSMDVLLAEKPGATQAIITSVEPIPVGNKSLVLAAPAKVIAERPDIREAERKLASATAQQGVAVAGFFPDISLSGFLGLLSPNVGDLVRTSSKSWDVGGNVLWPILNYGKLSANLKAADAREQEALADYQKSIITALSDVERSVTAYTEEDEHRVALDETVSYDQHAVDIAEQRYKEGLSSFIEVLDAERTLYTAQNQTVASRAMASQNLVAVYKSLGGGWKIPPSSPASTPEIYGPVQPATKAF